MEKGNEEVKEEKKVTKKKTAVKKKATTKKKTTKKTKTKAKKQSRIKTDAKKEKKKAELKEQIADNLKGLEAQVKKDIEEQLNRVSCRPKKYETEEELQYVINDYFRSCMKPVLNARQQPVKDPISGDYIFEFIRPFTMSGLAEALDMSRQTLLNYSSDERFFDTIERARRKVERFTEEKLFEKETCNGSKFSLSNNFGWSEKNETKIGLDKLEDIL